MIIYFANRRMEILGQASTSLPNGYVIKDDDKAEEVENGVVTFSCYIGYDNANVLKLEEMTAAGNYLLRANGDEAEFYTIIDSEKDTRNQEFYIYAEDAGLDLINEIVGTFEATEPHTADWYINKFAADAGFEIGLNEIPKTTSLKLKFDSECSVTERIAEIAAAFGGFEVSYSFKIDGLTVSHKYINIHERRGKDTSIELRLNRDIDRIVTKTTVANLATELVCEGGTPEDAEEPLTLEGFSYNDGNFYIEGKSLKSRTALNKWGRFNGGHIAKPFSCDALTQGELCTQAIAELKRISDVEINYEIDINTLPEGVKIGDRVDIVDDVGELYISSRILLINSSVTKRSHSVTLGEHLIKTSGISQKVANLAADFAKQTVSVKRAQQIASNASLEAEIARSRAEEAMSDSTEAYNVADEAAKAANTATESANNAKAEAQAAQAAVNKVEQSVSSLETTVENAKTAADNAQLAADTATQKAEEAKTAAENAQAKAESAETAAGNAQTAADSAIAKADSAIGDAATAKTTAEEASATAQAAKLDAEQANKDIEAWADNLETYKQTVTETYSRKTDLTESEATLQAQITANANELSLVHTKVTTVDETANDAATKALAAYYSAQQAQEEADRAAEDAQTAQTAADNAREAANAAADEASLAQAAADEAKSVLDQAEAGLEAAKADFETVSSRADATEEEIAAAQAAVDTAQAAADKAKTDAETARATAEQAQITANTANLRAEEAQIIADGAAQQAENARKAVEIVNQSAASEAIAKAKEAENTAATAQETANNAKTLAETAQERADDAIYDANEAEAVAREAAENVATAKTTLQEAQQRLANLQADANSAEADILNAMQDVDEAQEAVDEAIAEAKEAAGAAALAAEFAAVAQNEADQAKKAADKAQTAANEAKAAADKAQADVDNLAVRVTTAETNISKSATKIELSAYKDEVTTTLGGYYTKSETDSKITQKADSINLSVKSQIEEIDIGGRNLLLNSDVNIVDSTEYAIAKLYFGSVKPVEGATYTITLKGALGEGKTSFLIYNSGGNVSIGAMTDKGNGIYTFTGEWKVTSGTYTANNTYLNIFTHRSTVTAPCSIEWVKLENGNKATAWTAAPEDVTEEIGGVKAVADDVDSRLTQAETTIKLLSDAIAQIVRKNGDSSVMIQEGDGVTYYFDIGGIKDDTAANTEALETLKTETDDNKTELEKLKEQVAGYEERFTVSVYEDEPCIILHETDSDRVQIITNTRRIFARKVETNGVTSYTDLVITDFETTRSKRVEATEEAKIGGWVWQTRNNGKNLGLVWKGAAE